MIINHNMPSLNTYNKLNTNNTNSSKSLEKLSSGLRINKAGDDAAGLAISEKMRGQIRGLDQATANAQDGISMIQTAEGGLNETHNILQRMRELAVQSATDSNTNDDRIKIQSEVDQLAKEITRVSNNTEFNTQNLLAGGLNDTFHIGANAGQNLKLSIGAMDATSLGVADAMKSSANLATATNGGITSIATAGRGMTAATGYKLTVAKTRATASTVSINFTAATPSQTNAKMRVTAATTFTGITNTNYQIKIAAVNNTANTNIATAISYSKDGGSTFTTVSLNMTSATGGNATIDGMNFAFSGASGKLMTVGDTQSFTARAATASITLKDNAGKMIGNATMVNAGTTVATIGDTTTGKSVTVNYNLAAASTAATAGAKFDIGATNSTAAATSNGIVSTQAVTLAGVDVTSQSAADKAITSINNAITTVSQERSKLGAYQNRLEHTISNLGTSSENSTAAESRIRDVDMAKEMMSFQKNQILSQAATSMLAQANQQPQGVLKLLG